MAIGDVKHKKIHIVDYLSQNLKIKSDKELIRITEEIFSKRFHFDDDFVAEIYPTSKKMEYQNDCSGYIAPFL